MDPLASTEFPTTKPLPPIGITAQENEKKSSDTEKSDRSGQGEEEKSSSSSTGFDRQGEGSARPRIIRGFRPEPISDDDMEDDTPRTRMEKIKRKTYDGREITMVTLETQTDWDWVETAEQTGTARTLAGSDILDEKDKPAPSPKSGSSKPETQEDKGPGDSYQYQMPYSDEYGIPILDLSSDTDDESTDYEHFEEKLRNLVDDGSSCITISKKKPKSAKNKSAMSSDEEVTHKKVKDERKFIPSVGPPNILQLSAKQSSEQETEKRRRSVKSTDNLKKQPLYQRESEKQEITAEEPEARIEEDDYDKDEQGNVHGMFSGRCEFCQKEIKPFPTVEQQIQFPPESLYCCSDYREFVEFVLSTSNEMEEEVKRKNKMINIKPHEHVGSKQERNAAKEKAVQRMRERELQRRQQEASGLQQNFFASGSGGTSKVGFVKHPAGLGNLTMKDMFAAVRIEGNQGKAGKGSAPGVMVGTSGTNGLSGPGAVGPSGENPRGAVAAPYASDAQSVIIPTNDETSDDTDCIVGCPANAMGTGSLQSEGLGGEGGEIEGEEGDLQHSFTCETYQTSKLAKCFLKSFKEMVVAVARQMKTINYQLSSQKCLEEGWTLRAPSPLTDELGDDVFIPEPLNPDMIADGRLRERPLIEKFYETGQKFLTMFPDGTGNVFYPSGNLAILISSVKLGQYFYTIHHDMKRSGVIAAFEPNGYGYCYFPNGEIRLYIDQYGGIELDNIGGKKRKWSWKDQITHIHAPPFQPICIGLNRNMGVRVMSQENISLTFSSNQRSCRFNMGARLKVVAPENAPLKEIEENHIFLEEKKNQVDAILDKVTNLLKFPNHPKLNKMLPPLHISAKATKNEKMKKDRQSFLAQQSARDKKQAPVSVN